MLRIKECITVHCSNVESKMEKETKKSVLQYTVSISELRKSVLQYTRRMVMREKMLFNATPSALKCVEKKTTMN